VELNPRGQYADDRSLRARQQLWRCQVPFFDIAAWVLDLAGLAPDMRVLDAGCGNGVYLRALRARGVTAVGCDLSQGMLGGVTQSALVNADVTALPMRDGTLMWCSPRMCSTWCQIAGLQSARCAASWRLEVPAWRSPTVHGMCGRCAP
jgi:SAM-dependent methyltransferase